MHDAASAFVWAQVTGSEPSPAPGTRGSHTSTEGISDKNFVLRKIEAPGESIRYRMLNELLIKHAHDLTASHDAPGPSWPTTEVFGLASGGRRVIPALRRL